MKTAAQGSAKWVANAGAAAPAWLAGVQGTQVDVMARAVAAIPAAIAGYTQSLQSGAYARAVQASGGTANWKTQSEAKSANYGVGITAGTQRQAQSMQLLMNALPGIVAGLPARGPAGSAQNYARSAAVGQALHAQKGAFKG